jgi:OmpA-OmpF porin, OOP family
MKINLMLLSLLSASPALAERPHFPDTGDSWRENAMVLDSVKVQGLAVGMSKRQIYRILGAPHFDEGLGADVWNYWFIDAAKANCQLRIDFDDAARIKKVEWNAEACSAPKPTVADKPAPEKAPSDKPASDKS